MVTKYDPNSIVDTLRSQGQDSSYSARSVLAKANGITNYTGTAEQNTQLLSKVGSIQNNVGYADSTTKAGQFSDSSNYITDRAKLPNDPSNKYDTSTGKLNPNYKDPNATVVQPTTAPTPDSVASETDKATADQVAKNTQWEIDQKKQIEDMYQSNLSLINAKYASTVSSIGTSFSQRVDTLKKINNLQLERTKAYGMSNAQYMPLEYTDAITDKEKEQAKEVSDLEMQRESLLQEAKYNMESGKVEALKGNQESINNLEKTMEIKVQNVLKDYDAKVKIANDLYEADKKTYFDNMRQRALNAVSKYEEEFKKATTTEQKDKIVAKALAENGNVNNPDELTIYKEAFATKATELLNTKKDELAMANTVSLIADRNSNGSGTKMTEGEKTKVTNNAVSDAFLYLKEYKDSKKQRDIDPTEYKTITAGLKDEYGASAVIALDKLISDGRLRVDYGTTK